MRVALYAGVALAGLIASPALAQSEVMTTTAKDADKTLALAQADQAPAATQQSSSTTVHEVVVTGIRKGIQDAIGIKKADADIVEVISAEEIGKLPDNSIAESIARLPGLTAQRLDGRAQVISIRGLGPDFSTALLNGREQVTTGDNRGVEFDQYPSELLGSVVVYKTPDAALLGQGLAGTVDLRTIRPLAYGHRTFAVSARGEWDDLGALNAGTSGQGWRGSASYIDQSSDGRFGLTLGFSYMDSPNQAQRFNSWGYPTTASGAYVIGGQKSYVQSEDLKRAGALATLEFKPIPTLHSTIDLYYSRFDNLQIQRGIEMPLWWGGLPLNPGYTVDGNMVTRGEFDGVKGVVRNDGNKRHANLKSFGWNTEWKFADKWSAMADISYSDVYRVDQVLETYSGTGLPGTGATDNVGFAESSSAAGFGFSHVLNYADPNVIRLTSPQGWGNNIIPGGQDGYLNQPHIYDQLGAIRGQIKREFDGPISSIELGFNYSDRHKKYIADEWFLGLAGNPASMAIPSKYLLAPTSLGYLGLGSMVSYDPFAIIGDSSLYYRARNPNGDVETKNWRVGESVFTTYLMGNIKTALGSVPVTGNVGIQIVQTDQTSSGFAVKGTSANPAEVAVSGGANYTEPLPSMNLTFHLGDDQLLRLAAARTLARARMDQMSASQSFSYNYPTADTAGHYWSGSGGNPALRPWIADAADLSWEKYFGGRKGYVSAAIFYKNLETYVWQNNAPFDYTGFPCGCTTLHGTAGTYSEPQNRNGGTIYGAELAFSLPLSMVHPWLDGFGILGSVSDTESSIDPGVDPSTGKDIGRITLPGLSKTVANATFYYEKNGWQFRISNRYRSKFLGEVAGFGDSRTFREVAQENVTDAQFGYTFNNGPAKNLSVLFQINNLTDEPFSTFSGDQRQVIDYQRYGRVFLFGVNWKY